MKSFPGSVRLQTAFKNEGERQQREMASFAGQRWENAASVHVTQAEMKAKEPRSTF